MLVTIELNQLSNETQQEIVDTITNPHVLTNLAFSENTYVRAAVAENIFTPLKVLKKLAQEKSELVRSMVARNQKASSTLLAKLAQDPSWDVKIEVAKNNNTSPETLDELVGNLPFQPQLNDEGDDVGEFVRYFVARNKKTLPQTLLRLAYDYSDDTRCSLAKIEDGRTPIEALRILANDLCNDVLRALARNQKIPVEILVKLDERRETEQRYNYLIWPLSANPNTPSEILEKFYMSKPSLSSQGQHDIDYCLAWNPNTPIHILEELSDSDATDVQCHLIDNSSTPTAILEKIVKTTTNSHNLKSAKQVLNRRRHAKRVD